MNGYQWVKSDIVGVWFNGGDTYQTLLYSPRWSNVGTQVLHIIFLVTQYYYLKIITDVKKQITIVEYNFKLASLPFW